jgi:hypothetical protein
MEIQFRITTAGIGIFLRINNIYGLYIHRRKSLVSMASTSGRLVMPFCELSACFFLFSNFVTCLSVSSRFNLDFPQRRVVQPVVPSVPIPPTRSRRFTLLTLVYYEVPLSPARLSPTFNSPWTFSLGQESPRSSRSSWPVARGLTS